MYSNREKERSKERCETEMEPKESRNENTRIRMHSINSNNSLRRSASLRQNGLGMYKKITPSQVTIPTGGINLKSFTSNASQQDNVSFKSKSSRKSFASQRSKCTELSKNKKSLSTLMKNLTT